MRGSLRLEARQPASLFAALLCGVGTAFFKVPSHAALRRRHDSDPWLCLFLRPAGRVAANGRYDGNVGGFLFSITFDCQGDQRKSGVARGGAQNAQEEEATCIMERICDVAERAHEMGKMKFYRIALKRVLVTCLPWMCMCLQVNENTCEYYTYGWQAHAPTLVR
jgi:hypothetical protein